MIQTFNLKVGDKMVFTDAECIIPVPVKGVEIDGQTVTLHGPWRVIHETKRKRFVCQQGVGYGGVEIGIYPKPGSKVTHEYTVRCLNEFTV